MASHPPHFRLSEVSGNFSIARLDPKSPIPPWSLSGELFSVSRTPEELSIVCASELIPPEIETREDGWALMRVVGQLDFSLTGVLSTILSPLANGGISVFALSTFDTDYLLVKEVKLEKAKRALTEAGFEIS